MQPSSDTTQPVLSDKPTSTAGEIEQDVTSQQISTSSGAPSSPSKRRYRRPTTPLQLAAQASDVATSLLNGLIDLEVARAYGTIARVTAQALSTEIQTGRFLKQTVSLDMGSDVFED
jgi:hypothetical protein